MEKTFDTKQRAKTVLLVIASVAAALLLLASCGGSYGGGGNYSAGGMSGGGGSYGGGMGLGTVVLVSPANTNMTATSSDTVPLTWNAFTGASTYVVEVNTTSGFTMPDTVNTNTGSATTFSATLGTGITYYWKVTALNSSMTAIAVSAVWTFKTP